MSTKPGQLHLSLQVDPAYSNLADDVLAWAEQVADGPVTATISEAEQHVADALVRRGFVPAREGPFFDCLSRALEDVPDVPPMPPGYTIRAQYNDVDIAQRAAVHRAAWSSEDITGSLLAVGSPVRRRVRLYGEPVEQADNKISLWTV